MPRIAVGWLVSAPLPPDQHRLDSAHHPTPFSAELAELVRETNGHVTVTVDTAGKVFVKDDEVAMNELVPKLTAIAINGLDERIYVRGDKAASYGAVMRVMGAINGAGFRHIALVALKEPDS